MRTSGSHDKITFVLKNRFNQMWQEARIIAQIGVQKHHNLNRAKKVLHTRIAGSSIAPPRFVDPVRPVRRHNFTRAIRGSIVAYKNLSDRKRTEKG